MGAAAEGADRMIQRRDIERKSENDSVAMTTTSGRSRSSLSSMWTGEWNGSAETSALQREGGRRKSSQEDRRHLFEVVS